MLYDDANQVEVRYVISLAHHDVTIHGDEAEIPDGELWVKRNAICLSRRLDSLGDLGGPTPPFYLFCENLSDKEDFYFAMLQNQAKLWDSADRPPKAQEFDVQHIVSLVQRLHSSEEQLQTRWINAFFGRLFLALYRTPELEEFVRNKIAKKIARVNKPSFISKIGLQKVDLGEGAPIITNPRLKDLTVDGSCCVETDIQYTGNFRVEISATVRIDLGPRFKAREVDIVLAVVLKKLEGHMLVRFKPPPSNRFWMTFETMPRIVMDIQPIVSSKQITFGPIVRTIESKIREMVAESIVLPFWDDVPFLDTTHQRFRGGVWQRDTPDAGAGIEIPDESTGTPLTPKSLREDSIELLKSKDDRTMSMPVLPGPKSPKIKPRKGLKPSIPELQSTQALATSTGIERSDSMPLPRAIRSQTFSHAADPVVTVDNANHVVAESKGDEKSSATSAMIEISSRSPPASPNHTPSGSPPTGDLTMPEHVFHSRGSSIAESIDGSGFVNDNVTRSPSSARFESSPYISGLRSSRESSTTSVASEKTRRRGTMETFTRTFTPTSSEDRASSNISIASATAAAKKWSWGVFGKGDLNHGHETRPTPTGIPDQPIGRGHPHPPPGAPLPRPDRYALNRTSSTLPKRKPVAAPPPLPERPITGLNSKRPVPPPPLPRRKPIAPPVQTSTDELLVVQAPSDSAPDSPAVGDAEVGDTKSVNGPADAILLESESSFEAASTEADTKTEELEQDTQPLHSLEQSLSSTPEKSSVLPSPEQLEVS